MTKTAQPMGMKKYKATVKKQFLGSLRKYAQQLEAELKAVYESPDTIVGKLATAYQGMQGANQRLSALCACLIKTSGGKVKMTKEELESFKGMAINIKWELPEGVTKPDEADSFVFTYDAIPQAELDKQQQAAAEAAAAQAAMPAPPPAPDTPEAPPAPAEEGSTFVAAEDPADTVPSGTAFPTGKDGLTGYTGTLGPVCAGGYTASDSGPAGYTPPVSQ